MQRGALDGLDGEEKKTAEYPELRPGANKETSSYGGNEFIPWGCIM